MASFVSLKDAISYQVLVSSFFIWNWLNRDYDWVVVSWELEKRKILVVRNWKRKWILLALYFLF